MTLSELTKKFSWLDYYCLNRNIYETENGKVYWFGDEIELDDLVYQYFDDAWNWVHEDVGYEIDDCNEYIENAKEYGDKDYIEWFECLKEKYEHFDN